MNNFLSKFIFSIKKPKIIIVVGDGRSCTTEAIFQVLNQENIVRKIVNFEQFSLNFDKDEILIFETKLDKPSDLEQFAFLIQKSSLAVLVITQVGDIPSDKDFFAGEKEKTASIRKLAKNLNPSSHLVLNFDDETVREIKDETNLKEITFGFQEGADFRASDIKINPVRESEEIERLKSDNFSNGVNGGTNFKVNYNGNIVPIWLDKLFGKEQIYSALAASVVGIIFDLNLVEISQSLKNYHSLSGKMHTIKGIKNSLILDDSESATISSMIEAIEILGKLQGFKRKIAVLGDVIGAGKYAIEAHETIGEKVAKNTDLLFTFGSRAKFISQGAQQKGMLVEKIFQFDTIDEGKLKLQEEIKEGDLILVDGSKEMKMGLIIEEIKGI